MRITFSEDAFDDYISWALIDKKIFRRIGLLIKDIVRQPFSGMGKPEPLKYTFKGFWSRRIDEVNRLVYKVQ